MEKVTQKNSNKNSKNNNGSKVLTKVEKTEKGEVEKPKKISLKMFIIVISIMTLFIIASIITIIVESISIGKLRENMGQTFLNDGIISLKEQTSNMLGFSIINNIISGVEYPQKVELNCKQLTKPQVVRFKAITVNADGLIFDAEVNTTGAWIEGENGYYYYASLISDPMKVLVCNQIKLPVDFSVETENKNKHILIMNAETLDNDTQLISSTWKDLPPNWLNNLQLS